MGTKGRVKLKRLALLNMVKVFNTKDIVSQYGDILE